MSASELPRGPWRDVLEMYKDALIYLYTKRGHAAVPKLMNRMKETCREMTEDASPEELFEPIDVAREVILASFVLPAQEVVAKWRSQPAGGFDMDTARLVAVLASDHVGNASVLWQFTKFVQNVGRNTSFKNPFDSSMRTFSEISELSTDYHLLLKDVQAAVLDIIDHLRTSACDPQPLTDVLPRAVSKLCACESGFADKYVERLIRVVSSTPMWNDILGDTFVSKAESTMAFEHQLVEVVGSLSELVKTTLVNRILAPNARRVLCDAATGIEPLLLCKTDDANTKARSMYELFRRLPHDEGVVIVAEECEKVFCHQFHETLHSEEVGILGERSLRAWKELLLALYCRIFASDELIQRLTTNVGGPELCLKQSTGRALELVHDLDGKPLVRTHLFRLISDFALEHFNHSHLDEESAFVLHVAIGTFLAVEPSPQTELVAHFADQFLTSAEEFAGRASTYIVFVDAQQAALKALVASSTACSYFRSPLVVRAFWEQVEQKLRDGLLTARFDAVMRDVDGGVASLLQMRDMPQLKKVYTSFVASNMGCNAAATLFASIAEEWMACFAQTTVERHSVSSGFSDDTIRLLVELCHLHDDVCQACSNNLVIQAAMLHSVQLAIAKIDDEALLPEALAASSDRLLRRARDMEPSEMENMLRMSSMPIRWLQEKDAICAILQVKLAKRLLSAVYMMDSEQAFLRLVELELGSSAVWPLRSMLADWETSSAVTDEFCNASAAATDDEACPASELGENVTAASTQGAVRHDAEEGRSIARRGAVSVKLMTASHWPSYRPSAAPQSIRCITASFEEFYKKKTMSQRRVTWVHALGKAVVTLRLPLGTKDVTANLFQASILVALGKKGAGGKASVAELAEELGVAETTLVPHLSAMAERADSNILVLQNAKPTSNASEKGELGETTNVGFNMKFRSSARRFNLPHAKQRRASQT